MLLTQLLHDTKNADKIVNYKLSVNSEQFIISDSIAHGYYELI